MKKKLFPLIFIILLTFVAIELFLISQYRRKQQKQIIAPYYDQEVFLAPSEAYKPTYPRLFQIHLPIIMYHYVEYVKDAGDFIRKSLDIVPHAFENQLKTIDDNCYETYFVRDIPDILDGKKPHNEKSVILTFDDGYEDFYTDVLPLLKKYHIKATLYVVYNFIDRKGFLSKKELNEIVGSGLVEIGSHTLNHRYLKNLSADTQRSEIFESKTKLEKLLKIPVNTFAYPYGAFDDRTVELVKEASYSAAVSVIRGVTQSIDNQFILYRIRAGGTTGDNMIKLLKGIIK